MKEPAFEAAVFGGFGATSAEQFFSKGEIFFKRSILTLLGLKAQELELPMLDINSVEIPRLNSKIQFGIYNFSN